MVPKKPTICVKCRWYVPWRETADRHGVVELLWPDRVDRCGAIDGLSWVTGEKYSSYAACYEKNHGSCPDYEAKEVE